MTPTYFVRYLVVLALGAAGVGTVGATATGEWDLLAVFGMLDVLLLALAPQVFGQRPSVQLRPDLVAWLRWRAGATGESLEAVADRAVATYRHRLDPPATPPDGSQVKGPAATEPGRRAARADQPEPPPLEPT